MSENVKERGIETYYRFDVVKVQDKEKLERLNTTYLQVMEMVNAIDPDNYGDVELTIRISLKNVRLSTLHFHVINLRKIKRQLSYYR